MKWRRGTFRLDCAPHPPMEDSGWVWGVWGVSRRHPAQWAVTHTPSGLAITGAAPTLQEAKRLCEALERLPMPEWCGDSETWARRAHEVAGDLLRARVAEWSA